MCRFFNQNCENKSEIWRKILNFVKIIHYFSKLFTGVLRHTSTQKTRRGCSKRRRRRRPHPDGARGRGRIACRGERFKADRPTGAAESAKEGPTVGGVGCPPNCRTSGKPRGSSDPLEPFRKMLHFGKIPKKIVKFRGKNSKKISNFLTKILD